MTIGYGGWVRLTTHETGTDFFVRFVDRSGRLAPVEMYVAAGPQGSLDTNLLRRLPLGRFEARVNEPDEAASVRSKMGIPGPDLRRLAGYYASTFGSPGEHWVADAFFAQREGSGVPQAPEPPAASPRTVEIEVDARLDVPTRRDKGDEFYSRVAEVYAELAGVCRSPAGVLADENGVPVTTVHRWVKEARRRGFLGAGQRGKAN